MRISELRKIVREIVRTSIKESVFDDKGLERAALALPQTEEEPIEHPIEEGHSCGCNETHSCGCGGHTINERKYYVTYNLGRGRGKDLEKEFDQKTFSSTDKPKVFNSYNDAKKYAEKMEKMFRNSIGGGTAYWVSDEKMNPINESVNEEKVYIDYLNKAKGFKQDRIKFNSYEDAVKWAKKNFEKFSPDMIKYESINESTEPTIITQLRDVVKTGYKKLKDPKTGKVMTVDTYSASAIVKVYDALKQSKNKEQFASMGLLGMQSMAFKLIK
jgi:hypothetical protein